MEKVFKDYPPRVWASFQSDSLSYFLDRQCFALSGACPVGLENKSVYSLDGTRVYRADAQAFCHLDIQAVYRLNDNPLPYVPTGRIFVRFACGVIARDQNEELKALGYCIDELSDYAPHTAWIKSCSDNKAEALSRLTELRAIDGLENAEPQMLMPKRVL